MREPLADNTRVCAAASEVARFQIAGGQFRTVQQLTAHQNCWPPLSNECVTPNSWLVMQKPSVTHPLRSPNRSDPVFHAFFFNHPLSRTSTQETLRSATITRKFVCWSSPASHGDQRVTSAEASGLISKTRKPPCSPAHLNPRSSSNGIVPKNRILCPPAPATSTARFTCRCPLTSPKSSSCSNPSSTVSGILF
jgi:hypothetical protein